MGAIAILIVDRGLHGGFGLGFMAGAGAATVDTLYATVAIATGAAVSTAMVLGRDAGARFTPAMGLAFILGAGPVSLSWQTLLAGSGALAGRYLPPGVQLYASVLGDLIVIGPGVRILIELFS